MLSFLRRKPVITEKQAAAEYLRNLFPAAASAWRDMQFIVHERLPGAKPDIDGEPTVGLAVIASTFGIMLTGSTQVEIDSDLGIRLQEGCLVELTNHLDRCGAPASAQVGLLKAYSHFITVFAESNGRTANPFPAISDELLRLLYASSVCRLEMPDGSLSPTVHTFSTDSFMRASMLGVRFWRDILTTHRIVRAGT